MNPISTHSSSFSDDDDDIPGNDDILEYEDFPDDPARRFYIDDPLMPEPPPSFEKWEGQTGADGPIEGVTPGDLEGMLMEAILAQDTDLVRRIATYMRDNREWPTDEHRVACLRLRRYDFYDEIQMRYISSELLPQPAKALGHFLEKPFFAPPDIVVECGDADMIAKMIGAPFEGMDPRDEMGEFNRTVQVALRLGSPSIFRVVLRHYAGKGFDIFSNKGFDLSSGHWGISPFFAWNSEALVRTILEFHRREGFEIFSPKIVLNASCAYPDAAFEVMVQLAKEDENPRARLSLILVTLMDSGGVWSVDSEFFTQEDWINLPPRPVPDDVACFQSEDISSDTKVTERKFLRRCRMLLDEGADIEALYEERSVLDLACASDRAPLVGMLIMRGANPARSGVRKKSALFNALECGAEKSVKVLRRMGVCLDEAYADPSWVDYHTVYILDTLPWTPVLKKTFVDKALETLDSDRIETLLEWTGLPDDIRLCISLARS